MKKLILCVMLFLCMVPIARAEQEPQSPIDSQGETAYAAEWSDFARLDSAKEIDSAVDSIQTLEDAKAYLKELTKYVILR